MLTFYTLRDDQIINISLRYQYNITKLSNEISKKILIEDNHLIKNQILRDKTLG